MVTRTFDRRGALRGAGLIGAAAMAAMVPTRALADGNSDGGESPTGGWEVIGIADGRPASKVLVVLTEGGGALRSSQNDLLPSSLVSPCYGSWATLDEERVIGITFKNFRYANGALVGTTKIRVRAALNERRDHFSGPFVTELMDLGGVVVARVTGRVDGQRIAVQVPD